MADMDARITPLPEYQPDNWDAEVGTRIRSMLHGRGTQEDIAEAIGLSQTDVSKRIHGRVAWKGHELKSIADLFGVSISVIYGEPEKKGPTAGAIDPSTLLDLDSNQEPAGFTLRSMRSVTELTPRPVNGADHLAVVLPFAAVPTVGAELENLSAIR